MQRIDRPGVARGGGDGRHASDPVLREIGAAGRLGRIALMLLAAMCAGAAERQFVAWDGAIVIDEGYTGYGEQGAWVPAPKSGGDDWERSGFGYSAARMSTTPGARATWTPQLEAGAYRVSFYKMPTSGVATIEVVHAGGTATFTRDMQDGHQGWNTLGDFTFAAGTGGSVRMTHVSGTVYVDAVGFLPASKIDRTSLPPYPKPDSSLPRIDRRGGGNMVVCGEPRLLLYLENYERSCESPSDIPYMDDLFDKALRAGVNTLAVILTWQHFETAEGVYDHRCIDALIAKAKARNMHLIVVWFGSWRNLQSYFVPRYVAQDLDRKQEVYFPTRKADGTGWASRQISPFCTAAAERDGLALKALLARAREQDPGHQVLVAVQVQNEMPNAPDLFSAPAKQAWDAQVPAEVVAYLREHEHMVSEALRSVWIAAGRKTAGTWSEVLGASEPARKQWAAYHFGRYVEQVVRRAREGLDIPMYCNAWEGASPCSEEYMDMYHLGAPSLDGMGPDVHRSKDLRPYERPWNTLVVPEFAENDRYFEYMANHRTLLCGQYHMDVEWPAQHYRPIAEVVQHMMPILAARRYGGDLYGFRLEKAAQENATNFSARWEGFLQPQRSGPHALLTRSDDGVRVVLDGKRIIDNWASHAVTLDTATVDLVAGKRYPLTVEYHQGGGPATLQLLWRQPGDGDLVQESAVPSDALFTAATGGQVGLRATFFAGNDLKQRVQERIDPQIDYGAFVGAPHAPDFGQGSERYERTQDRWEFRLTMRQNIEKPYDFWSDWPKHGPGVNASGLVVRLGADEYLVAATKTDIAWRYADGGDIGVAWAETGRFVDGSWVKSGSAVIEDQGDVLRLGFPKGRRDGYGQLRFKLSTRPRLVNVALGKPARQSSIDRGRCQAGIAVDGLPESREFAGTVADADPHDWWEVDLGKPHDIDRIEITQTSERHWLRSGLHVFVADDPIAAQAAADVAAQPGVWSHRLPAFEPATANVPVQRRGRYVRVQLAGGSRLRLGEVRVVAASGDR